ncbi:type VI secretion system amidase effector protein Tae4 [Flavobacterium sp. LS1R47]|uniref:Type VI secretion system amidase effector protein Tae4 n=1 Tax=Flavobacterium frigoritolerans TaxID=2987686 RepID=A0A9X2ZJT0_9FLAO|nr:type VI secretion system amidase effector protein Tae4 [Flavobacterium frigoritolerans]MCV9931985.1 type VI secretion system amidase effector protein Tae4 [Flavobacterium frigoritolerans]
MDFEKIIPIELMQAIIVAECGSVQASPITVKRPRWEDVYEGYPKNATNTDDLSGPDFYKILFGNRYDLSTNLLDEKIHLYNGCAGKVSTALTLAKFPIKKINGIGIDFIASEGDMKGKGFISTASKMKKWLDVIWKKDGDFHIENPKSIDELYDLVGEKKGIYLMLAINQNNFGASGHVTLWTGEKSTKWVFGGHHYEASAKSMYFWELK